MKRPVICIPTSLIIKDNPWLSNSNSFHTILQLIMRFLACIVLLCTVLADFCAPTFGNTPYDLSSLTLSSGDYHVRLLSPDDSWNRTIVFNICRDTVEVPRDINGGDGCVETPHRIVGEEAQTTRDPAPAYLIERKYSNDNCYRLGLNVNSQTNMEISLYDDTDPAMGVNILYTEGDYCCPYSSCSFSQYRQRTLTISLRCSDAVYTIPEQSSIETSDNECDYKLNFLNVNACPSNCPIVENNVCGGHGVCGYDTSLKTTRCFCTSQYTGTDCSSFQYKSLLSVNTLVIAVTVILTLVTICTIFFVWNKLRKINVNPDAFESLENKFNELGQMTY